MVDIIAFVRRFLLLGFLFNAALTIGGDLCFKFPNCKKNRKDVDYIGEKCASDYQILRQPSAKFATHLASASADLRKRFTDEELLIHSRKASDWLQRARASKIERILVTAIERLTESQRLWVQNIWQCRDLLCVCREDFLCAKFLALFDKVEDVTNLLPKKLHIFENFVDTTHESGGNVPTISENQRLGKIGKLIVAKVGKAKRKEIRMLSKQERQAFLRAINRLKKEKIDGRSKYDLLVYYHNPETSPEAHFCAAFFPFHREMLKNAEVALRQLDPSVALPYFDPTLDEPLPNPSHSVLWTDDFLGGDGAVQSGPFGDWRTVPAVNIPQLANSIRIERTLGRMRGGALVGESDVEKILNKTSFNDLVYCVDPFTETVHGATHTWIGGHMAYLQTSPNDPIFFLYHCFLDSIWEDWRRVRQNRTQRETEYPSDDGICEDYCRASSPMLPFPIQIKEGLSNVYTDTMYDYAPRPTCSRANMDCGSEYLFCHSRKLKCISKVKIGGDCTDLETEDVCHKSVCQNGRCVQISSKTRLDQKVLDPLTKTNRRENAILKKRILVQQPQAKHVWIPITVIRQTKNGIMSYPNANIVSKGINNGAVLLGEMSYPASPTYYSGSAFAKMLSPFAMHSGVMEAVLMVMDENNQPCVSMCLSNSSQLYHPCPVVEVALSTNILQNDDLTFSPDLEQASALNWRDDGKLPDKFLFICQDPDSSPITLAYGQNIAISNHSEGIAVQITSNNNVSSYLSEKGCRNSHQCCTIWSGLQTCKEDSTVQQLCRRDCKICHEDTVDRKLFNDECSDLDDRCPSLAIGDLCRTNSEWMEKNCKKSCGVCHDNGIELLELCDSQMHKQL